MYGIRAFYEVFLPEVPILDVYKRHSTSRRLVTVVDRAELQRMLAATDNLKHRALIELLYGSGVRVAECVAMRLSDIDRANMLLRVKGKGDRERLTILAATTLETLTEYYRAFRPVTWLFEGRTGKHLTTAMAEYAVRTAAKRAGIDKLVTPHILRHSFATHLLESGCDIHTLQALLGHKQLRTTARYLHVVVPGGALSADRTRWKQAPARYLFPVEVMRTLFRAKMLDYLRRAVDRGEIRMHGAIAMYDNPNVFSQLLSQLYTREWVVYAKPPFGCPEQVVKYLGAYTHRVAISNRRIVALEPDFVTFSYKDRRDDNREKLMRLPIVEVIRRFMMHLAPARFVRIRHYGLLGNRMRRTLLPLCLQLLGVAP